MPGFDKQCRPNGSAFHIEDPIISGECVVHRSPLEKGGTGKLDAGVVSGKPA